MGYQVGNGGVEMEKKRWNPLDTKVWNGDEHEARRLAKALTDRFPFQFTAYGTVDPADYVVCVELVTSMDIVSWEGQSPKVRHWLDMYDLSGGIATDEVPR